MAAPGALGHRGSTSPRHVLCHHPASPTPPHSEASLRAKEEFSQTVTTPELKVFIGPWRPRDDRPIPSWDQLQKAQVWTSSRRREIVMLREGLAYQAPEAKDLAVAEDEVTGRTIHSGELRAKVLIMNNLRGGKRSSTPQSIAPLPYRCLVLCAEASSVPRAPIVDEILETRVPALVWGPSASRVKTVVEDLKDEHKLDGHLIPVYIITPLPNPGPGPKYPELYVGLVGSAGTLPRQVSPTPLSRHLPLPAAPSNVPLVRSFANVPLVRSLKGLHPGNCP